MRYPLLKTAFLRGPGERFDRAEILVTPRRDHEWLNVALSRADRPKGSRDRSPGTTLTVVCVSVLIEADEPRFDRTIDRAGTLRAVDKFFSPCRDVGAITADSNKKCKALVTFTRMRANSLSPLGCAIGNRGGARLTAVYLPCRYCRQRAGSRSPPTRSSQSRAKCSSSLPVAGESRRRSRRTPPKDADRVRLPGSHLPSAPSAFAPYERRTNSARRSNPQ